MKIYTIAILTILFFKVSYAQIDTTIHPIDFKKFNTYEREKKDKAVAFLWSSILPGAGIYYADDNRLIDILKYTALDVGGILWLNGASSENKSLPVIALILSKVLELSQTSTAVDEVNSSLRIRILSSGSMNNMNLATFTYNF